MLSTILGRVPKIEEYKKATNGIQLTKFIPSSAKPTTDDGGELIDSSITWPTRAS